MSYVIEYEPEALADLEKLTQAVRERVVKRMFEKGRIEPQVRLRGTFSNRKTPILS